MSSGAARRPTRPATRPGSWSGRSVSASAWRRRRRRPGSRTSSRPLRRRPIGLTDDELSNLGVVVVLATPGAGRADGPAALPKVAAAHYVRPLARDVHGHPQRLPPAVLATWDRGSPGSSTSPGGSRRARRAVGRRTGDFEPERERRSVGPGRAGGRRAGQAGGRARTGRRSGPRSSGPDRRASRASRASPLIGRSSAVPYPLAAPCSRFVPERRPGRTRGGARWSGSFRGSSSSTC